MVKSKFIMSLIEQIDKKGVGPQHKSIIDRCITMLNRLTQALCLGDAVKMQNGFYSYFCKPISM